MVRLEVVRDSPSATVDIVLVHGWHGTKRPWTYSSGEQSVFWPQQLLPTKIPNARIITYEYDMDLRLFWTEWNKICEISEDLLGELQEKRAETDTTKRPIIFVAHSLGGLLCENALVRATNGLPTTRDLTSCIRRIAFLGTPQLENDRRRWARLAQNVFRLTKSHVPGGLDRSLDNLIRLGTGFLDLLQLRCRTPESRIEIASFYESHTTRIGAEAVKIVEEDEARIPGFPEPQPLGADHQHMGEFKDAEDNNYRRVSRVLAQWVRELEPSEVNLRPRMINNTTFNGGVNNGLQVGQNNGNMNGFIFGGHQP